MKRAGYLLRELDEPWRDDLRCGPGYPAPNGLTEAQCDPNSIYPCCSTYNWCGNTDAHCKCDGCIDYSNYPQVSWREDLRCGPGYPAPNGLPEAQCDPTAIYPCCSPYNWCGNTDAHCNCDGCIDYSEGIYRSCADIDCDDDGDYTIKIGSTSVQVYCYNMKTDDPKTYLSLSNDQTFSTYYVQREASSQTSPPTTTIETRFSKLRFDPLTMKVYTGDYTFAETSGYYSHNCGSGGCIGTTAYVPVGVAKDCEAPNSKQGTAKIDLTGTPLSLATEWGNSGYISGGSFSFSSDNQVVDIQGGGYCGWSAPTPVTGNEGWVGKGGWFLCLCLTGSEECSNACEIDSTLPMGPIVVEKEEYSSCEEIGIDCDEDGVYPIKIGSSIVQVYCHDMDTDEPKTYIELANHQTYSSYYVQREASSSTTPPTESIETRFSKLRFDPLTMKVYTGDYTFAETSGYYSHNCGSGGCIGTTAYVPVGVAKDCEAPNSKQGTAKIDLRGTTFALATEWSNAGYISGGSSSFSSDNQVVDIQGGGYCGWSAPTTVVSNEGWVGKGGWFLCLCLAGSDECSSDCVIDSSLPMGPIA